MEEEMEEEITPIELIEITSSQESANSGMFEKYSFWTVFTTYLRPTYETFLSYVKILKISKNF